MNFLDWLVLWPLFFCHHCYQQFDIKMRNSYKNLCFSWHFPTFSWYLWCFGRRMWQNITKSSENITKNSKSVWKFRDFDPPFSIHFIHFATESTSQLSPVLLALKGGGQPFLGGPSGRLCQWDRFRRISMYYKKLIFCIYTQLRTIKTIRMKKKI